MKSIKILILAILICFLMAGSAFAVNITVNDGTLNDWGITSSSGFTTSDSWNTAVIGQASNGVLYWEEEGVGPGGAVTPGYGGTSFDIAGLYYSSDASNYYFAAVVGMPTGGVTVNGKNYYMGDIFFGPNFDYAIAVTNHAMDGGSTATAGDLYSVSSSYPASYYTSANPISVESGTDLGPGDFYYGTDKGNTTAFTNPDYYIIEASVSRSLFSNDPNFTIDTIHLANTCGNDVADLPVPEPATMLLLGTGLIGLGTFGRKKFFSKKA